MIKKLIRNFRERNYFNPAENLVVDQENFLKILKGEVERGQNYMVVGVAEGHVINSWAGQRWGVNSYELAQEGALWYGKFTTDQQSRILVPPNNWLGFDPFSKTELGKFFAGKFNIEPWRAGGFMQLDKDLNNRTLVSNLSAEEVMDSVNLIYRNHK